MLLELNDNHTITRIATGDVVAMIETHGEALGLTIADPRATPLDTKQAYELYRAHTLRLRDQKGEWDSHLWKHQVARDAAGKLN